MKIISLKTGVVYSSIQAASDATGIEYHVIRGHIERRRPREGENFMPLETYENMNFPRWTQHPSDPNLYYATMSKIELAKVHYLKYTHGQTASMWLNPSVKGN